MSLFAIFQYSRVKSHQAKPKKPLILRDSMMMSMALRLKPLKVMATSRF